MVSSLFLIKNIYMIQLIPKDAQPQYGTSQNIRCPSSCDWFCPHCGRRVNFRLRWSISRESKVLDCQTHCTGCRKPSLFLYLGFHSSEKTPKEGELYIYPSSNKRSPLNEIFSSDRFTQILKDEYKSSVNVYNLKEWTATAVLCRRLLEAITMELLPDEENKNIPLAKKIENLPEYINLQEPILILADVLRKGATWVPILI
jgi:hypothetical protein